MRLIFKNQKLLPDIVSLYTSGKTVKEVSKEFKLNVKTVRRILKYADVKIRGMKYNLLGSRFGKLTILGLAGIKNDKQAWSCRCECGKEVIVRTSDLTSGKQISCGCFRTERSLENIKKAIALNKISGSNFRGYKELSGRYLSGIKLRAYKRKMPYDVTAEFLWNLLEKQNNKCAISGEPIEVNRGTSHSASLDRIDSSKGYTENNVQWVHKDVNCMKMDLNEKRFLYLTNMIQKNQKTGLLNGTRAYLAGNLECSSDSYNWRKRVADEFKAMGIIALDPTQIVFNGQPLETENKRQELLQWRKEEQYDKIRDYMVPVVQKDLRQIDISDFVVFNFQVEKPTFGTTHELVIATQQKKPIFVCVGDRKKTPLWFLGIIKPKYVYNSLDEIIDVLKKINSGEKEISSERWRLLRKEFRGFV